MLPEQAPATRKTDLSEPETIATAYYDIEVTNSDWRHDHGRGTGIQVDETFPEKGLFEEW
jgi:hypothetical protein